MNERTERNQERIEFYQQAVGEGAQIVQSSLYPRVRMQDTTPTFCPDEYREVVGRVREKLGGLGLSPYEVQVCLAMGEANATRAHTRKRAKMNGNFSSGKDF
jgi:hypothetical protein